VIHIKSAVASTHLYGVNDALALPPQPLAGVPAHLLQQLVPNVVFLDPSTVRLHYPAII